MAKILLDNGIYAFDTAKKTKNLLQCPNIPIPGTEIVTLRLNHTIVKGPDTNLIDQKVDYLSEFFGFKLEIKDRHVPVVYKDVPECEEVDVTLCTRSGMYTPYRNWPYFEELKVMFDSANITYLDLNKPCEGCRGYKSHWALNAVNKSKLYIGLETGTSHYVSKFAAGKGLILQSGYSDFEYWAKYYDYEKLDIQVPCSPCFLNRNTDPCPKAHKCMVDLTPGMVFDYVLKKLNK